MQAFETDRTLPALPIPALEHSRDLLKELIAPLSPKADLDAAEAALEALGAAQCHTLHEALLRYRDSLPQGHSWLRPLWDDMYLTDRTRLPINVNYAFKFLTERWGEGSLCSLIAAMARVIARLRSDENFSPEKTRDGFFSMDALDYMIYTRIPSKGRDLWYYPPRSSQMTAAVVCGGRWFTLALEDKNGVFLSAATISKALSQIKEHAAKNAPQAPLGALTCAERDEAAELRTLMLSNPQNRINLEALEKSVFVVCLDSAAPQADFMASLVAGPAQNRWHDKSLQIISNGAELGANFEHSGCDAGLWAYLLSEADRLIREGSPTGSDEIFIRHLNFKFPENAAQRLEAAAADYTAIAQKISFCNTRVEAAGKTKIKSIKCSPDAFVQLLYQMAYFSLTGTFRSVYEAASTRSFYQGRTEAVRPCSPQSTAFVRAYFKGADKNLLKQLFHDAIKEHANRIQTAKNAQGAERHLTGLSHIAKSENLPLPEIFETEAFRALKRDTLSTSSMTAPYISFFGFGPVASNGLGIGYGVKDDALCLSVSAYGDSGFSAAEFAEKVEKLAGEIYSLFDDIL